MKSIQQDKSERQLNDRDRGKRSCALPRSHDLRLLRVDGHPMPVLASAGIIAAAAGSHAAVDRAASDCTADATGDCAEQAVTDDARTRNGARDAADHRARRRRRAPTNAVTIVSSAIIMVAMTGAGIGGNGNSRRRGCRHRDRRQDFV
jgi:hypothetical protein